VKYWQSAKRKRPDYINLPMKHFSGTGKNPALIPRSINLRNRVNKSACDKRGDDQYPRVNRASQRKSDRNVERGMKTKTPVPSTHPSRCAHGWGEIRRLQGRHQLYYRNFCSEK
jgi:hypothetical protein